MTERQNLSLNRPRKLSSEEHHKSDLAYRKKVWVKAASKKQKKNLILRKP